MMRFGFRMLLCLAVTVAVSASAWAQDALPSVAIAMSNNITLTCQAPQNTPVQAPSREEVIISFRDRLGAALLNTGEFQLIERDKQEVLDREVKARLDKGEALEVILKDVASRYRLDFYLTVNTLSLQAEYSPIIFDRCTRGSGLTSASWLHVASGLTKLKPEANVPSYRKSSTPPGWFDDMTQMLARKLVDQICPPAPIQVVSLDRASGLVAINKGSTYGLRARQKLTIREPRDAMGIPGQAICEAEVTDRIGESACMVKLKLDKKTAAQVMDGMQKLLDGKTPPEVELQ